MTPISFPEHNVIVARDHTHYTPIPAHIDYTSAEFVLTCCWKLSWRERLQIALTGTLWQQVLTFAEPLQPQKLSTHRPSMPA